MAYQTNDDDENAPEQGLLGGYMASKGGATGPAMSSSPIATMPTMYGAGGSGPSATGHVNFDRIYAANEATAQREAGRLAANAGGAAKKAQQGLANMQGQFSSQSKAAVGAGPTQQQRDWSQHASTGVTPGKKVTGAYVTPTQQSNVRAQLSPAEEALKTGMGGGFMGQPAFGANQTLREAEKTTPSQSYVTEAGEGLQGGPGVVRDADGNVVGVEPGSGYDASQAAADEAAVRAGAAAQYGGPDSLSGMEGYSGLLADYGKADKALRGITSDAALQATYADENAGPYLEGGSKLDAALAGQAGRGRFANLREAYKGIGGELGAANKASAAEAATNRAAAEANAGEYQGLLDAYLGRQSAEQEAEDESQAGSDQSVANAFERAGQQHAYDEAQRDAMTGINAVRNVAHGVAHAASPVDQALQATGNRTILESGTQSYGQQYAGDKADSYNAGNKSAAWGADDADVYDSMTATDWAEFNALPLKRQQDWIAQRKAQLRGGGGNG